MIIAAQPALCCQRLSGFSLVELSIVLVILGLLAGGVISGQSLIRAAELRSVATQVQRYTASVYTFHDKYMAIPGDMTEATKFWGRASGATTDAECAALTTASTDKTTCNGNGDGFIAMSNATDYEAYRAWQHLANAGLVEGSYSGVTATATLTKSPKIGQNIPSGKLSQTGFTFTSYAPINSASAYTTNYFDSPMGNVIYFGTVSAGSSYSNSPALKPEEAWNIDTKLDDGKPAYGRILSTKSASGNAAGKCNTNTDPTSSEYKLTDSGINCPLLLLMPF